MTERGLQGSCHVDTLFNNEFSASPALLFGKHSDLLIEGEKLLAGIRSVPDISALTNVRLNLMNVQSLNGREKEFLTFP